MKKRAYKAAIARSGSTLLSTPARVKYADDQPRDAAGRWSASGGSASPVGEGKFGKPEGKTKLDDNNTAHWSNSEAGHFAQGYAAYAKQGMGRAGPAEERMADQFRKDWTRTSSRSGFAGSGHEEFTHNTTGRVVRIDRMATGKNFWDTAHSITVLPPGYTSTPPEAGTRGNR